MSSCLKRYSVLLNTLDACWIAVDEWSNSSRCRIISIYLSRTWGLYTWSYLDNIIIIRFSINCSTIICSPTVEYLCSWEKPLVKHMAPGSIFIILIFQHLVISFAFYFSFILLCIFITKIPKNIILSYLSDLTLISDLKGLTTPYRVGCEDLFVLCRCEGLARTLLLDLYLGSQKLREILTLLCCIILSSLGKTNASSRRRRGLAAVQYSPKI